MSVHVMGIVWKTAPYRGVELLVLLALADYANDEGECWPKMKSIAQKARCTENHARRCVRNFEASGYVKTTRRPGLHSTYVVLPNLKLAQPEIGPTVAGGVPQPGEGAPVNEPSSEPSEELGNSLERTPVTVEEQSKEQEQKLKSKEPKSKDLQPPKAKEQKNKRTARPNPKEQDIHRTQQDLHLGKHGAPKRGRGSGGTTGASVGPKPGGVSRWQKEAEKVAHG